MTVVAFRPVTACWICGNTSLRPIHQARLDLSIYNAQDPELAAYSERNVWIQRCEACGFAQPAELPALDRYFGRMYDQRWSPDWVEREFESDSKAAIFAQVLAGLERRLPPERRDLLDVGAHVGKFVAAARACGWRAEGIELNPTTADYARRRTGTAIHEDDLKTLAARTPSPRFDAVTLTDVLEHIPEPLDTLRGAARMIRPGGWVAVKVPCGPNQLLKERLRVLLKRAERVSIADNLVHVSHFTPRSLARALEACGFDRVHIEVGQPERCELSDPRRRGASNAIRRATWVAARALPVWSPLAFNLQAFARRTEHAG